MLGLKTERREKNPREDRFDELRSVRYLYQNLLKNKVDVNEGNLLAISQYQTPSPNPETFYAAWIKPNIPYIIPEIVNMLERTEYNILITTDRVAIEDFILEEVYGVNNPFK